MKELQLLALPVLVLWGLFGILLLFRRGLPVIWKVTSLLLAVFYGVWLHPQIRSGWQLYTAKPGDALLQLGTVLFQIMGLLLLVAWPLTMIQAVTARGPSGDAVQGRVRFLAVVTMLYWLLRLLLLVAPEVLAGVPLGDWLAPLLRDIKDPPVR